MFVTKLTYGFIGKNEYKYIWLLSLICDVYKLCLKKPNKISIKQIKYVKKWYRR